MLKLGYKASAEQFSPAELLAFTCLAEELAFDSAFVSDHFQPWRHTGGHAPNSVAWLGAAGAKTSRITLGTSVLTPTFRYHPAIVAQAFGTLGVLFPGRIVLGVGVGEALNEVASSDLAWPDQKERTARFREALELIALLWREERVTFAGRYYRTKSATIYDKPAMPIPIYIAASGPVNAKRAGAQAAGFITTSGKNPELYTTLLGAVAEGLASAGRAHDDIDRMIEVKVSFDPDLERAREETRLWGALALSPEQKVDIEDPLELERLADALPVERAASRWIVSADPDEHVERIAAYVAAGFNHLVFHAPGTDQAGFLRRYAEQIVPRLRARFG